MAVCPSVDLLKMREGTLKNMVVLTRIGLFESKQKHREREREIYIREFVVIERELKENLLGLCMTKKLT